MNRFFKLFSVLCIITLICTIPVEQCPVRYSVVYAHSGRTDSNGGHKDNKNKSGLGSYHYHCGGHPAHLHPNGVCPYASTSSSTSASSTSGSTSTSSSSTTSTSLGSSTKYSKKLVKAVQKKLNKLGYDCGKVDGVFGKKTKAALKKFQKDYDLTVDGIIGKQVKKALNIKI